MKRDIIGALVITVSLLPVIWGCSDSSESISPEPLCSDQGLPEVDENPELLHFVEVEYPAVARDSLWEGVSFVAAWVALDSTVCDAFISTSSGYAVLDNAALEAIRQSIFAPATKDGEAIVSAIVIGVGFKLSDIAGSIVGKSRQGLLVGVGF